MIRVFVPGIPQPQGSKRALAGRVIDINATRLRPWRATITAALAEQRHEPILGPVEVGLWFSFPRPAAHHRANGDLKDTAPDYKHTRPDIDKLTRAVLDAATDAGIWRDDAQVAHLEVQKLYANPPGAPAGVAIEIHPLTD